MLSSKRFLIPTFLLFATAAFGIHYFLKSNQLMQELQLEHDLLKEKERTLKAYHKLLSVDSLFHKGQYTNAMADYQTLDTLAVIEAALEARMKHGKWLVSTMAILDSFKKKALQEKVEQPIFVNRPPLQPIQAPKLEEVRTSRYDSLTFALMKAKMQIQNLEGQLKNNVSSNYLTFKSSKGNEVYYVGAVKEEKANGDGVALLSTGSRYVGSWKDNEKHGTGNFYWQDGAYYEGEYEEDKRNGQGSYHFPSGELYVGGWKNDLRDGEGVFYNKKGRVIAKGVWKEDKLVEKE
ncbi:MAG: hypothetical protein AAGG68_20815 [Bacteroidota bacterium]